MKHTNKFAISAHMTLSHQQRSELIVEGRQYIVSEQIKHECFFANHLDNLQQCKSNKLL